MVLKLFKAVWFLSMLTVLANLLYTYASLPETVVVQEEGSSLFRVSRESFFYAMTAVIALVNVLTFLFSRLFTSDLDLRTWFYGLVILLNTFFIIAMNFIALFNSGERFDYSRIEFIIYGSIGLFIIWTIAWPIYLLYRKLFIKQSV